ncbi:MAG: DUF4190 domain-containing protein [Anaerolineales bacterium]|nr:DUF4190 domain-containing protein [Anaerolineales bacterium]
MGYQQQYPPAPTQSSATALISLIAGIASWFIVPVLGAIVAVIAGHMAKKDIRNSMGRISGDGMATIGLVLGYAHLALVVISACVVAVLLILGVSIPLCTVPFWNDYSYFIAPLLGF